MIPLCLMADVDTNDGVLQSNHPSCAHCVVNGANPNASGNSYRGELILGALCHPFHRCKSPFATPQISEEVRSSHYCFWFVCQPILVKTETIFFLSQIQRIRWFPLLTQTTLTQESGVCVPCDTKRRRCFPKPGHVVFHDFKALLLAVTLALSMFQRNSPVCRAYS